MAFLDAIDALDEPSLVEHQSHSAAKFNDQLQIIGQAARSDVLEPIQNSSESMKEYQ
jgi:hypothetical protein